LRVRNCVVISDTHSGCQVALCSPKFTLDSGGTYRASALQRKIWDMWVEFWKWVPQATNGDPFCVVHNGDALEGRHHKATTQISQNLADQENLAYEILAPVVEACGGRYYHVRGTGSHVGEAAENEEKLARRLGAISDGQNYARNDLWLDLDGRLIHFLHHIGATGSQAYESTAVMKELVEEFVEAARWGRKCPDAIVRSHRHREIEIAIPKQDIGQKTETGKARAIVTPCWQGKTPFVWRIPGGRLSTPQFGGGVFHNSDTHHELFYRSRTWTVDRSKTVKA